MPSQEYDAGSGAALAEEPAPATTAVQQTPAAPPPAGDGEFRILPLASVVPSLTNPRRGFNQAKLEELASSIRATGVGQPVLVRPITQGNLIQLGGSKVKPEFEIISGERRLRASVIAQAATIPALIRHWSDAQVLEFQLVENLQRDDLTAMEEAEGYDRLIKSTSITKEAIGDRIGKSRGYVYGRLKLLDLIPDAALALNTGKLDASMALLIARIPDPKLQKKALATATDKNWQGEPPSYRAFRDWVQKEVMLPLSSARFKIAAEDLVPEAGSCKTCPKRTGANPDLFSDVKGADICTDPPCYHAKEEAHDDAVVAKAAERGQKVILGKEAREISPYEHAEKAGRLEGYMRLDKPDERLASGKPLKKLLGADCPEPVLLQSPHSNQLIEVLPTATVNKLLKEKGVLDARQARAQRAISPAESKRMAAEEFERAWRVAAIEQIAAAVDGEPQGPRAPIARAIATMLLGALTQDERAHIAKVLGLGKVANREGIEEHIQACGDPDITRVMLLILMENDRRYLVSYYPEEAINPATRIEAVADAFRVDLEPIKKAVKAERDQAERDKLAKEKARQAAAAKAPAARYRCPMTGSTWSGLGQKPKWLVVALQDGKTLADFDTTATANQQQADALDEARPLAIGFTVRFKSDLKGMGGKVRKVSGRTGTVDAQTGGTAWSVRYGPKPHETAIADATELEVLATPADTGSA